MLELKQKLGLLNEPEKIDKSAVLAYFSGETCDCFSHLCQCFIACILSGTSKQNSSKMKTASFTMQ